RTAIEHLGERFAMLVGKHVGWCSARQPIDTAKHHLALSAGALEVGHHAAAEALEHGTDRLLDQLFGAAARERQLAEMRDLGLIACLCGAALVGALALGDVASDTAVTLEAARGVEYRLAADQEPARIA